jgi:hypothetical protein
MDGFTQTRERVARARAGLQGEEEEGRGVSDGSTYLVRARASARRRLAGRRRLPPDWVVLRCVVCEGGQPWV